jgi:regulator of sigma E protease
MIDFIERGAIALIVLGVIIVIHELGHFLVAKFFRIKVDTFSVGFGPRLFGFRYGETDYRISAFPLGGYVKMAGEMPGDNVTGAPDEFISKPKWQRFLVASAGPAMNILLAVGLLTGLFMYGTEVPEYTEGDAVVGRVEKDSPAEAAGIQVGDRIVRIAEKENPNWEEIQNRVITNGGQTIVLAVERNGQRIETTLTPEKRGINEAGHGGMLPKTPIKTMIAGVQEKSPAEAAGLKAGDEVIAVSGIDLKESGRQLSEIIHESTQATLPVTVLREGNPVEVAVTPVLTDGRRMIGITIDPVVPLITVKENFSGALARSIDKNMEYGTLIFQVLGKLVRREASMKSVDGPIGIMRATGDFWEQGWTALLALVAMISLNLGLMNLLPIPILDGGVMLLLLVEGVMRQDLSLAFKERVIQVSFVFLLTLMVFVLYNDVVKLLPIAQPGP